ncbi:MAG: 5-formyltetrahydrofolate cyclo-ligase [Verrucomicrobia bacterium]|nr:5-formyltetrahydrofolate cyclo-ligase [Verrucomicrobiota bacterium]MCH8528556.1 5-formyltetrahydrofolate cyclo-ligase [Kiritimatiellia bacterium]
MTDKQTLRRDIKARIAALSPEDRRAQSEQLCDRLASHPAISAAKSIGIFLPLPDEPDLTPFYTRLAQPLALPVEENGVWVFREITDLRFRGSENHGIRLPKLGKPVPAADLDVILVPGRAFTPEGHRLGRGKGIYDRLLLNTRALTLGIAFDIQLLPALPQEPHDLMMHDVLR